MFLMSTLWVMKTWLRSAKPNDNLLASSEGQPIWARFRKTMVVYVCTRTECQHARPLFFVSFHLQNGAHRKAHFLFLSRRCGECTDLHVHLIQATTMLVATEKIRGKHQLHSEKMCLLVVLHEKRISRLGYIGQHLKCTLAIQLTQNMPSKAFKW